MQACSSTDATRLRQALENYLKRHGQVRRQGTNGRFHVLKSRSSHLRKLIVDRYGQKAPMSQQAISNFLAKRSRNILLDHAGMLAAVIGMPLALKP